MVDKKDWKTLKNQIILDFDDTLVLSKPDANGVRDICTAKYNKPVLRWATQMMQSGRNVVLYTARGGTRQMHLLDLLAELKVWFNRFTNGYNETQVRKPPGCAWVDDLAIHPALIQEADKQCLTLQPNEMLAFYDTDEFKNAYSVYLTYMLYKRTDDEKK